MRIALIATDDAAYEPDREPASLGGRAISLHQLDFALGLGCSKILCQGHGATPEASALRQAAEGAGAQFQVVRGPRDVPAAVRGEDELVVFARGLLPDSILAYQTLLKGPAILSLPVKAGAAAGFEFLDMSTSWAGVLALPGRHAATLDLLPEDGDAISGLVRIARQAGIVERGLPEDELTQGRWALLRTAEEGAAAEPGWLKRRIPSASPWPPSAWLARALLRRFGAGATDHSRAGLYARLGAGLAIAGSLAASWYLMPLAAFALLAVAVLAIELTDGIIQLKRPSFAGEAAPSRFSRAMRAALDLALVGAGSVAVPGALHRRLFLAVMPVALLQAWPVSERPGWRTLATDRLLVIAALSLATVLDVAEKGFMAAVLALLALRILAQKTPRS